MHYGILFGKLYSLPCLLLSVLNVLFLEECLCGLGNCLRFRGVCWVRPGSSGHCLWVEQEPRVTPKLCMVQHYNGFDAGLYVHRPSCSLCWVEPTDSLPRVSSWYLCKASAYRTLGGSCSITTKVSTRSVPSTLRILSQTGQVPGTCTPLSSMAAAHTFYSHGERGSPLYPECLFIPGQACHCSHIWYRLLRAPPLEIESCVLVGGKEEGKLASFHGPSWTLCPMPAL